MSKYTRNSFSAILPHKFNQHTKNSRFFRFHFGIRRGQLFFIFLARGRMRISTIRSRFAAKVLAGIGKLREDYQLTCTYMIDDFEGV